MKSNRPSQTLRVTDPRQRRALTSPLRQEILDRWADGKPRTVADIATALGRPATAIYYHVHRLEEVGLLMRAGTRPGPRRDQTLYRPVAKQFDLTPAPGHAEQITDSTAAMKSAQAMALRDLRAALESDDVRFEGPDRNLIAFRLHARLSPERQARANSLLDELLTIFEDAPEKETSAQFYSLTVTFASLRGRDQEGSS